MWWQDLFITLLDNARFSIWKCCWSTTQILSCCRCKSWYRKRSISKSTSLYNKVQQQQQLQAREETLLLCVTRVVLITGLLCLEPRLIQLDRLQKSYERYRLTCWKRSTESRGITSANKHSSFSQWKRAWHKTKSTINIRMLPQHLDAYLWTVRWWFLTSEHSADPEAGRQ